MIDFDGRGILLDVEGTTSSISFVYDAMFPYVRRELDRFLTVNFQQPEVVDACKQIATDVGSEAALSPTNVAQHVTRLMDDDVKATGLKALQGLIWKSGFDSGELVAHLFDDVVPAWNRWKRSGMDLRIYSSGSVTAQKLFFGHTQQGDLLHLLSGHYDTRIGNKKESVSYARIAEDWQMEPASILFLSDVVAELDAARETGMATGLCLRPGNAAAPEDHEHRTLQSFAEVVVAEG